MTNLVADMKISTSQLLLQIPTSTTSQIRLPQQFEHFRTQTVKMPKAWDFCWLSLPHKQALARFPLSEGQSLNGMRTTFPTVSEYLGTLRRKSDDPG